jgi:ATP-dependent Clp protease ATP-binding subunit ClpA
MMFERFTDTAREIAVQAQANARRLGHSWIGCEHLLMAAAMADDPVGAVLRDHGVTRERIEATILSTMGPLRDLDKEALASIGIDLDAVRTRVEAAFGPDALTRALPAESHSRRSAWGKGPLAELTRRRRRRHAGRNAPQPAGPVMELSLREADALHVGSIGAQHITLALLIPQDGTVPRILAALGVQPASVRAAILDRYRKAS